jgi:hypothetical protein
MSRYYDPHTEDVPHVEIRPRLASATTELLRMVVTPCQLEGCDCEDFATARLRLEISHDQAE